MSHRPYPDVDRALRQLARRRKLTTATPSSETARLVDGLAALAKAGWSAQDLARKWQSALGSPCHLVDEYRLSTRPGVVGGGS